MLLAGRAPMRVVGDWCIAELRPCSCARSCGVRRAKCTAQRAQARAAADGFPVRKWLFYTEATGVDSPCVTAQRGGGSFAPAVVSAMASTSCERPTVLVGGGDLSDTFIL